MGWPHWKNVNFSTFWTSCFYSLERLFFVLEYHEIHFPSLNCLKKNFQKWPFLDQNHRLTSLKKCQFFSFFNFLFLEARKTFFRSRILKKYIFLAYVAWKIKFEKWPFLDQNHGLTRLEKCQFFYFLNFLFL